MIIRQDKGNGVSVMDRAINDQPMSALLNDKNRFIKLYAESNKVTSRTLTETFEKTKKKNSF